MDRSAFKSWGVVAAAVALCVVVALTPVPQGWTPGQIRAGTLTVAAIALWATGTLPIGVTAIAYLLLAMLLDVQPAAVVFSGFHSSAFWLVFAGVVVAVAVTSSGLGARIARYLTTRVSGSYLAILSGVAVAATTLNFLMPSSMGRILMLIPIVLAMADRSGFTADRPGRSGMIMVATIVSIVPAGAVMTALVPNLVMVGAAENLYDIDFTYTSYLLVHFPVMGALRTIAIVFLAQLLFQDVPEPATDTTEAESMSLQETQLAVLLGLALALWMTDAIHGIAPAWIGLGVAVILLLPGLRLLPSNTLSEKLDYNAVFYTAGVLSMGAVITGTGLAAKLGGSLMAALPITAGADGINVLMLTLLSTVLGPLVTNPAVPAVLSPLAGEIAELTALPIDLVLMTQVTGFSNVLLPYQASPVIIGMTLGGVSFRAGTKMLVALTLITLIILLPLQYSWWHVLGLFG